MMAPKRMMAWLTVEALSTTLVAAPKQMPHSTRASSEEPFRSFRMLDAKLSLLTLQQDALKVAFNPVQSGLWKHSRPVRASDGGCQKYEPHSGWNREYCRQVGTFVRRSPPALRDPDI